MFKQLSAGVVCLLCTWQLVETASAQQTAGPGRLQISVPANASVYINNRKTNSGGALRRFESPGLLPGKEYVYEIRVVINQPGKKLEQTKRVVLRSSEEKRVVFDLKEMAEANAVKRVAAKEITEPEKETPQGPLPHAVLDLDGPIYPYSIAFSPDGACLTTLSNTKTPELTIWDVATGKKRFTVPTGGSEYVFRKNGQVLAASNGEFVAIYNVKSGRSVAKLQHPGVRSIEFIPKTDLLITSAYETKLYDYFPEVKLKLWDTKTWSQIGKKLDKHMPLRFSAISDDGKFVAGVKLDGKRRQSLGIWEVQTGEPQPTPPPESLLLINHGLGGCAFLAGSHDLWTPGCIWNVSTRKQRDIPDNFKPSGYEWNGIRIAPPTSSRITEVSQRRIEIRDPSGKKLREYPHPFPVRNETLQVFDKAIAITQNRQTNALHDSTVILNPDTGRRLMEVRHEGAAAFNSTGELVATIRKPDRLLKQQGANTEVRKTQTGALIARFPCEKSDTLKLDPSGKFLAIAGKNSVKLWDISKLDK